MNGADRKKGEESTEGIRIKCSKLIKSLHNVEGNPRTNRSHPNI